MLPSMAETQLLFDKLRYVDRLISAGMDKDHARAQAEALEEALRESVATKSDLLLLKHDLTVRMGLMSAAIIAILTSIKYFG
jgi:hypothetical protein